MKAMLLAAGEGTRLRPLTLDRPKPMVPIGGRPILEHLVGSTRACGIREMVINLHYCPDAITEYFGDGSAAGVHITYSRERALLGSAGAVKQVGPAYFSETFLVLYGDVLTDIDLRDLVRLHRERGGLATLALYEVEDPSRAGIVQTAADGRVSRFVEKPVAGESAGNLANAGVYVLEPAVLDWIPAGAPCDFGRDVFPALLSAGIPIYAHRLPGYVQDIGSPERYAQAEEDARLGRFRSPLLAEAAC